MKLETSCQVFLGLEWPQFKIHAHHPKSSYPAREVREVSVLENMMAWKLPRHGIAVIMEIYSKCH